MRSFNEGSSPKSVRDLPNWLASSLSIGEQVRRIRQTLGMTQAQLAERAHLTQSMIAEIESGKRSDLCLSTIGKLAKGLQCDVLTRLVPEQQLTQIIDDQSARVAKRLVAASSGQAAIELQSPAPQVVRREIARLKRELVEKRRSALWQTL